MKAILYERYGSPDVLELREVEKPAPNDDQVLVKIHAASVNAYDRRAIRTDPFFLRFTQGLLKPKNQKLGMDLAGRVEAVGKNVKLFQPGDEVFGDVSECGFGAFAEYVCATESALAPKPASMSFEEAAAVPVGANTALQGLRDKGQIQPGQEVLINGASGGVGTFAVQIAKSFGANVTGVCSTSKMDMVRSLGADHVIDYTREDFTKSGQHYDLILDIVANHSISDYNRLLTPKGIYVLAGFTFTALIRIGLLGPRLSRTGKQFLVLSSLPDSENLVYLGKLCEAGTIAPLIERRYPLSEVADALRYYEEGHAQGKLVINVIPVDRT